MHIYLQLAVITFCHSTCNFTVSWCKNCIVAFTDFTYKGLSPIHLVKISCVTCLLLWQTLLKWRKLPFDAIGRLIFTSVKYVVGLKPWIRLNIDITAMKSNQPHYCHLPETQPPPTPTPCVNTMEKTKMQYEYPKLWPPSAAPEWKFKAKCGLNICKYFSLIKQPIKMIVQAWRKYAPWVLSTLATFILGLLLKFVAHWNIYSKYHIFVLLLQPVICIHWLEYRIILVYIWALKQMDDLRVWSEYIIHFCLW